MSAQHNNTNHMQELSAANPGSDMANTTGGVNLSHQPNPVAAPEEHSQVLSFVGENRGDTVRYDSVDDSTFYEDYKASAELGAFLSRPVLIKTITWSENSTVDTNVLPWKEFFNNTAIKKKIDNYAFICCNLKVKVMINASPFYYGICLCSYNPLTNYNGGRIVSSTAEHTVLSRSQRPHIWLYPQFNTGGEMMLPFVYNKNWLQLTNATDLEEMGNLEFLSPIILENANSVSGTGCTIQVYAWAENVYLAGPTEGLAVQSKDEYGTEGIISKPASAIATAAGLLGEIPIIGPYMTATSMAASAVASIAEWFGYTNTPIITDVMPYKSMPFHSLASTEIGQPVDKLTFDPKNELTIDPRVVGLSGQDEMDITSIVTRESYLRHYSWTAAAAAGDLICNAWVGPGFHSYYATTGVYSGTPLSHVSKLFKFWRGDVIIRVRFICSQFHRGRARITWDPVAQSAADNSALVYNKIVDITETPDVEVRIPYLQAQGWLKTAWQTTEIDSGTLLSAPNDEFYNGTFSVKVFTQQTGPSASSDVEVVLSVRAADNFQFAGPVDLDADLSPYVIQSQDVEDLSLATDNATPQITLGNTKVVKDTHNNLVYMGESIKSLRQILRRSTLVRIVTNATDTTSRVFSGFNVWPRFPLIYGYDTAGRDLARNAADSGNVPFNFSPTNPFSYIANCYLGKRGSVIWHFNADSPAAVSTLKLSRRFISRTIPNYKQTYTTASTANQDTLIRDLSFTANNNDFSGVSLTNQRTQCGLSVLVPMYSPFRFLSNDPLINNNGDASVDDSDLDSMVLGYTFKPLSNTTEQDPANTMIHSYFSIGTDFSFLFFLNVPSLYYYSAVPSPST